MAKITKLTAAQEARLVEFREEWRQIGLCCDPADFDAGDEVIRGFYKRLGKDAPIILHFSSPAMCELAVNFVFAALKDGGDSQLRSQLDSQLGSQLRSQLYIQLYSQLDSQLGSQLYRQLDRQLGSQLYIQLYSQLYSQLDSQLYRQLYIQLYSQLDSQLGSQLYSQLDSQLYIQLRSQLRSQLGSQLYSQLDSQLGSLKSYFLTNRWGSQHWCSWEAFYLFGHEIGVQYKAENIALLLEWARLSKSVGWWAPWDGICFVSDRPRRVQFDAENRLHCETGKAVEYSDSWGVSAWHGTRVPDEWITDRASLTAKIALTQENLELRRAAIEIVGWHNVLRELGATVVDEDENPEHGTLVEVQLPDLPRRSRFIHVQCGTGREFAIGVPNECQTVFEAQAWMAGMPVSKFQYPTIRT